MHRFNLLTPMPFLVLLPDYPQDKMAADYLFMIHSETLVEVPNDDEGDPTDADR